MSKGKKAHVVDKSNSIGKIHREPTNYAGHETDRDPIPVEEFYYFGWCPTVHRGHRYRKVGKLHIFSYREHRTRWIVGENLFSTRRFESYGEQEAEYRNTGFGESTEVAPGLSPCKRMAGNCTNHSASQGQNDPTKCPLYQTSPETGGHPDFGEI